MKPSAPPPAPPRDYCVAGRDLPALPITITPPVAPPRKKRPGGTEEPATVTVAGLQAGNMEEETSQSVA